MNNTAVGTIIRYSTSFYRDPNKKTIDAYNKCAQEYIQNTIPTITDSPPEMRDWIDTSLDLIDAKGSIFEIGSATTRDASYIRSKGYNIICSDAAENFVKLMRSNGEPAIYFNILEDKLFKKYDMIYANGVFPHFTSAETRQALRNIYSSLRQSGIIAFSIKQGHGEEWITEKLHSQRFAHYWSLEDIDKVLREEHFKVIYTSTNGGLYPSHRWVNIIAKRD